MLDVGCWMLGVGCWMLGVGCWMLDAGAGCWMGGCRMNFVVCFNVITCLHKAKRRKYISEEIFEKHYKEAYLLMNMMIAFRNTLKL